jgi:hypothetical protein
LKKDISETLKQPLLVSAASIERRILLIQGEKVLLDSDLAELYAVETRTLIQAVKRNKERFPADFMFQLSKDEYDNLRSQIVISSLHGGRRTLPYVFTEQGVAMLSSVLRSQTAIQVNIEIIRTFVKLRHLFSAHKELADKLNEMELLYDSQFGVVFDALRELSIPQERESNPIGFIWDKHD